MIFLNKISKLFFENFQPNGPYYPNEPIMPLIRFLWATFKIALDACSGDYSSALWSASICAIESPEPPPAFIFFSFSVSLSDSSNYFRRAYALSSCWFWPSSSIFFYFFNSAINYLCSFSSASFFSFSFFNYAADFFGGAFFLGTTFFTGAFFAYFSIVGSLSISS